MKIRKAKPVLMQLLLTAVSVAVVPFVFSAEEPRYTLPEEVVITGQRNLWQLRSEMIDAEKKAYDIFNQFNDEKRFHISCSKSQPTGTRFLTQVCQPKFQIDATSAHGRAYLESYAAHLAYLSVNNGEPPPVLDGVPPPDIPMGAVIASQQEAYQSKLRQVALEHPEFLEAIIQYTELRKRYEGASASSPSE